MMRRLAVAALLILACGVQKASAADCSLTITKMNFGTYTGAQINGYATGTVKCNGKVQWNIPLDAGTGVGATESIRKMTGPGGATLDYLLFTDSALTNNWGNTTGNEMIGNDDATVTIYGQLAAGPALAPGTYTDTIHSATTSFTVTAVIQAACTISATTLSFGVYSGAQKDATSTVSVTCTNTTAYYVNIGDGQQRDGQYWPRMLGPSGSLLSYRMYQNAGLTVAWRNTQNVDGQAGIGNGMVQSLTVYGRIASGQNVLPGSYGDTVVTTLWY